MRLIVSLLVFSSLTAAQNGTDFSDLKTDPPAILIDAPPEKELQRSCLIRMRGGGMRVLSAAANDPAISVDVRERVPGELYLVLSTFPPGYQHGESKVSIQVRTDSTRHPLIEIPVQVASGPLPTDPGWTLGPKSLVGKPWPGVMLRQVGSERQLVIKPALGEVGVVVFSAHWCGHCDDQMPQIVHIHKDYAPKGVEFLGVAAGTGNGAAVEESARMWGVDWPLGFDAQIGFAQQLGVKAYPVLFVIGRDGIVEAVHARRNNHGTDNGLDTLDVELRTELDLLLSGGNREQIPDWERLFEQRPATRPAAGANRPEQGSLKVASEIRVPAGKPGAAVTVPVSVRNEGLKPARIAKIIAPEGVTIPRDHVREIAGGGLAVVYCSVVMPAAGPFSLPLRIEAEGAGQAAITRFRGHAVAAAK